MKILLEELPHQEQALKAILDSFLGMDIHQDKSSSFANPLINGRNEEKNYIDVKMETGTGKTYVYTRLIYELHQKFGLHKFILVVPSPAIKEGTKNFITSDYAKQHFSQFYENSRIELCTISAGDFKAKSGRKNFPAQLFSFIDTSGLNTHSIQVLLINAQMLNSASMTKDDYDQTIFGGITSPIQGLKMTRPVVLMDEPHRFPRGKAHYQAIEALEPQLIVRFGATFPETTEGKGKNKITRKDYYRQHPQFDLTAIESFNDGLVKGIDIYYPNLTEEQAKNHYIVESLTAKSLTLKQGKKTWKLHIGDDLSEVDNGFEGNIKYSGNKLLSNERELEKGMVLLPNTFFSSYQELIIQDAIDKHFDREQINFLRGNQRESNAPKIKTLSLFFIDNIKSYRSKDGWLKKSFEKHLKRKLNQLIKEYELKKLPREAEYLDYLKVSMASLNSENQNIHAGYFGEDRGSNDESIQEEINDILKNKEKLLSFKDKNGQWETRRFLFSKWTLREGWDNPNIFVIAKLRTSGSEASKIQEVGRGLRLPVDEHGHRVQQSEFESRLAFLIGYDEKEFANLLVGEINSDSKVPLNDQKLDDAMIRLIVSERQKVDASFTEVTLLKTLDTKGIINRNNEFQSEVTIDGLTKSGFEWTLDLFPELDQTRLRAGTVRVNNNGKALRIKLHKKNWQQLKDLWQQFSRRYMLEFERINDSLELIAEEIICDPDLYIKERPSQTQQRIIAKPERHKYTVENRNAEYSVQRNHSGLKYGKFLKQLVLNTNIPVKVVHPLLMRTLSEKLKGDSQYLSTSSLSNITQAFSKRFEQKFAQHYVYKALDFQASTSIFDLEKKSFKIDINAELLGKNEDPSFNKEPRFLYELPPLRYDSADPELKLLKHNYPKKVSVFGKLPKSAIKVPKYTGGSTTPDFVYIIERADETNVYLLVETKAENMRINDQVIIEIQRKFFKMLKEQNIAVEFLEATNAKEVLNKITQLTESRSTQDE